MEGQSGLSELSVISWVSAVEGCPLSEIPLLQYWVRLGPVASQNNATENTVTISIYQYAYYVHHSKHSHLHLHSVIIVYEWIGQHFHLRRKQRGWCCLRASFYRPCSAELKATFWRQEHWRGKWLKTFHILPKKLKQYTSNRKNNLVLRKKKKNLALSVPNEAEK